MGLAAKGAEQRPLHAVGLPIGPPRSIRLRGDAGQARRPLRHADRSGRGQTLRVKKAAAAVVAVATAAVVAVATAAAVLVAPSAAGQPPFLR